MTLFQGRNNVSLSTLNQHRNFTLKQRWYRVDPKKLLCMMIIQCLRTVTLNDVCSDLIWLQIVVFSSYFMKVSRKWPEEASIFSKLQVYGNIPDSFLFSITLKDGFCNNVILQIFSWKLGPYCLQPKKELSQIRFLGVSRTNTLLRCI